MWSHLSPFFRLPVKVTGIDKRKFQDNGELLEMLGDWICEPCASILDLLEFVNSQVRFPRQCTIPQENTLTMREVDLAMGWDLVDSPQVNPIYNPACLLHWRVLLVTFQWLDKAQRKAIRDYNPVTSGPFT